MSFPREELSKQWSVQNGKTVMLRRWPKAAGEMPQPLWGKLTSENKRWANPYAASV